MNVRERNDVPLIAIDQADDFMWIKRSSPRGHPRCVALVRDEPAISDLCERSGQLGLYTVVVHLAGCPGHELCCDRRPMRLSAQAAGRLSIHDRASRWQMHAPDRCDCIAFQCAAESLNQDQEEVRYWDIDMQAQPVRCGLHDQVMHYLALALLPVLADPGTSDGKYVMPLLSAAMAHLATTYGCVHPEPQRERGRLAGWQIRRVRELIATHLDVGIGVADLADACRLSASHFSLLFKRTVGATPHQWLLEQRVERAKHLLRTSSRSLSDIAYATGFADQSHFARVFSQRVRTSPQVWRRQFGEGGDASSRARAAHRAGSCR